MYSILKKILFCLDPETAHKVSLESLKLLANLGFISPSKATKPVELMGLKFPNPIGLAAGLDKNGDYIEALAALGFGFIEIGTVTPKPQSGNPKPRLFRLVEEEALINRLGFNNKGLDYVVNRLKKTKYKGILGVNIGKNRDTPIENAQDDYILGFRAVAPFASYVTVNISSPNTAGLRDLQQSDLLSILLKKLKQEQSLQKKYVPLVVKIAPDLLPDDVKNIADILLHEKIDGVIATNTTVSREGVESSSLAKETGGLSGKPLTHNATQIIKNLALALNNKIPIIGCGGISSAKDGGDKISAGASLVQVYTGLIYQGPKLIQDLIKNIEL
jgi:dihydroorotate dehydrogenase